MDLRIIKKICESKHVGIKSLAAQINMSEANLHRCINNNKIQAQDLENIAIALDVDVREFFSPAAIKNDSPHGVINDKNDELVALSRELVNVIGKIMNFKE